VTVVVGGRSAVLLATLELIDSLRLCVVVPGHGKIPTDPEVLIRSTPRHHRVRDSMQLAVRRGTSQQRALAYVPPMDARRR
jgi:hypothetical protein